MNFERGGNIIKNINIGLNAFPEKGRSFLVRFKLRESCPDFYPLQKLEEEGKPIIAICTDVEKSSQIVRCEIPGIFQHFFAYKNNEEWVIE